MEERDVQALDIIQATPRTSGLDRFALGLRLYVRECWYSSLNIVIVLINGECRWSNGSRGEIITSFRSG